MKSPGTRPHLGLLRTGAQLSLNLVPPGCPALGGAPGWMWSVKAVFGIGFLVTSQVAAVVAGTGSCQLSAAANNHRQECVRGRAASSMATAVRYLG